MTVLTCEQLAERWQIPLVMARKRRRQGWFPHAFNVGTPRKPCWRIPVSDVVARERLNAH
jgi:hypothetical protein